MSLTLNGSSALERFKQLDNQNTQRNNVRFLTRDCHTCTYTQAQPQTKAPLAPAVSARL